MVAMRRVVTLVVSEPVEPFRPESCESIMFFCGITCERLFHLKYLISFFLISFLNSVSGRGHGSMICLKNFHVVI